MNDMASDKISLKELISKVSYSPERLQKLFFSIDLQAYFRFMEKQEPSKYCGFYEDISRYVYFQENVSLGKALKMAYSICQDGLPGVVTDPTTGGEASAETKIRLGKAIITKILVQPFSYYLRKRDPIGFQSAIIKKLNTVTPPPEFNIDEPPF